MDERGWLAGVVLVAVLLFAFSYLVNERYPAEPYSISSIQDKAMPHYTGDTFRHIDPVARIFSGEKDAFFIDNEWTKVQVMVFRPVYPFLASLGYRLTGNMSLSFSAINFFFFVALAASSFLLARKFGLDAKYSLLVSVLVLSSPVVLIYSTLFMLDVPLIAMGTLSLLMFWKAFNEKKRGPNPVFVLTSLVVVAMLFTKMHYLIYLSAPIILYAATKNRKAAVYSIAVPALAGLFWVLVVNGFWNSLPGITQQYAYIAGNMGCPTCDTGVMTRLLAFLSITYSSVLFLPLGIAKERDRWRLSVLLSIALLTIIVASSGYIGALRRYYLPLLFPVAFYGANGMKTLLSRLDERRENCAVAAIVVLNIAIGVFVVLAKYRGFSGTPY